MRLVQEQNYVPVIKPYVEGSHKEYKELQDKLKNEFDETQSRYDAIEEASKSMHSLDPDATKKKELFDKTMGVLQEAAKKGDYENMGRLARREARNFSREYEPIAQQVQNRSKYQEDLKELIKSGKTDPETAARALAYSDYNYNKQGGLKKTDAGYVGYSGHNVAENINEAEMINKYISDWKANKVSSNTGYSMDNTGALFINRNGKKEYVDEREIRKSIEPVLRQDPKYMSYVNQKALLSTYNNEDADLSTMTIEGNKDKADSLAKQIAKKEKISDSEASIKALQRMKEVGYLSQKEVENLSPQQRVELKRNAIKENTIHNAVEFGAQKAGFSKFDEDLDTHAVPAWMERKRNGLMEYAKNPDQSIDSQVYTSPIGAKFHPLELGKKVDSNEILSKYGYAQTTPLLSGGVGEIVDKSGNPISKEQRTIVENELKLLNDPNTSKYIKISTLSAKNNPMLKEIFHQTLNENRGKSVSNNTLASIVEKRYNSKQQSLSNVKDDIFEPKNPELYQDHIIGNGNKLGSIVNSNIYDETTGQMIPFNQFMKMNDLDPADPDDIKQFTSSAKFTGNIIPKYSDALHTMTFNGKTYRISGSNERLQQLKPIREAFKVVSENLDQVGTNDKPIDFSNILPGLKGIALAGHLDNNGKFIKGDVYNEKDEHIKREPVIKLTETLRVGGHEIKKGEYISYADITRLAKQSDITYNRFSDPSGSVNNENLLKEKVPSDAE